MVSQDACRGEEEWTGAQVQVIGSMAEERTVVEPPLSAGRCGGQQDAASGLTRAKRRRSSGFWWAGDAGGRASTSAAHRSMLPSMD